MKLTIMVLYNITGGFTMGRIQRHNVVLASVEHQFPSPENSSAQVLFKTVLKHWFPSETHKIPIFLGTVSFSWEQ